MANPSMPITLVKMILDQHLDNEHVKLWVGRIGR